MDERIAQKGGSLFMHMWLWGESGCDTSESVEVSQHTSGSRLCPNIPSCLLKVTKVIGIIKGEPVKYPFK